MLQQSHLLLFSLAITNLLTGKIQPLPSVVLLIGFSQNLMPLSQPLAFSSSQPPSCILTYFPPGVEQKLTMSYLKQSFVSSFINLYMTFFSIWGPTLIIPFVIGCFLSACFIFDKSRLIVCEYFESSQSATYKKNRFHPQSVQPYKLETCITPLTSLGLIVFGFLELIITVGDTMNSSWLYSETAMWY